MALTEVRRTELVRKDLCISELLVAKGRTRRPGQRRHAQGQEGGNQEVLVAPHFSMARQMLQIHSIQQRQYSGQVRAGPVVCEPTAQGAQLPPLELGTFAHSMCLIG